MCCLVFYSASLNMLMTEATCIPFLPVWAFYSSTFLYSTLTRMYMDVAMCYDISGSQSRTKTSSARAWIILLSDGTNALLGRVVKLEKSADCLS